MSAFKYARKKADEMAAKVKQETEQAMQKEEAEKACIASFKKAVESVLNEFDGVQGIKRSKNRLYKNKLIIADMGVAYERWQNSNYDYKVEESGYVIRYNVYNDNGVIYRSSTAENKHSLEEYFGEAMAIHLT